MGSSESLRVIVKLQTGTNTRSRDLSMMSGISIAAFESALTSGAIQCLGLGVHGLVGLGLSMQIPETIL